MSDGDDVIPGQNWIMCNICCRSASTSPSRIAFYLTKCGHIFCGKCLIGIASSRDMARACLYCKKKITICRISRDMPQMVQTYFRCPKELLAESMVEIMQVIRFQTMHAACLVKRFNTMRINYEKLRRFCCEILHKKIILERELMNKVELQQHNNTSVDSMTIPVSRSTTATKNLHSIRNVETPKTSVTSESISKSGTESSIIGNSTCYLNESVVVDMAKISIENSVALRMSRENSSTW
ncbi:zinc-RING finger domain family protein [Acanthocheilonema viteae]